MNLVNLVHSPLNLRLVHVSVPLEFVLNEVKVERFDFLDLLVDLVREADLDRHVTLWLQTEFSVVPQS